MIRLTFFCLTVLLYTYTAFSQTTTTRTVLEGDAAKDLMKKISPDSAALLSQAATAACNCIDSVAKAESDPQKELAGVSACIDAQVHTFQLMVKFTNALTSDGKEHKISLNVNKNSNEYKHYYFEIERWLRDSCAAMNAAINTNDVAGKNSFSDNAEAMAAYNAGVPLLQKEAYEGAIPFFEKAVKLDKTFAFAWDNLGICYRRTNKLEKAENAYKASLKADPRGKTPMQNLAVVYLLQKKDDDAIATYKSILRYYDDDPEAFYGIALVYLNNKQDAETALDYMCQAYNLYIAQKSPFRSDAEKIINSIYSQMKKENKLEAFNRILKQNNISPN